MKKVLALLAALALAIGAVAVTASAEETTAPVDQVTSATTQAGRHGQFLQVPDQNGGNNQLPQMPGRNGKDTRNSRQQAPGMNVRGMKQGRAGRLVDPDRLLKDGVITQEVYDAIISYIGQQQPQQQADGAPAEGSEPPALPDGSSPAGGAEPPAAQESAQDLPEAEADPLLKELLDNGSITQEQYDALQQKITAPAASGET